MKTVQRYKILNAWHLKIIMIILMLLDHLRMIYGLVPVDIQNVIVIVSRCVAPVFAFLAVQGILHTRNARNYCLRLWLLAIIMFIGNAIINQLLMPISQSLPMGDRVYLTANNNVIFTLAMGVTAITVINQANKQTSGVKGLLYILAIVGLFIAFSWGEWGSVLIPFMLSTYYLKEKHLWRYISYVAITIIAILLPFGEPLWFLALPFLLLYNGERGLSNQFTKYFFYVFYPAHLWVIVMINFFILK